ncbi:MAG: amidohydrolase family protein, partial [Candidatus Limnocylindrales bacterium]
MAAGAIDLHTHYFPPAYMDLARSLAAEASPVAADARLTYDHPQRSRDPMFSGALDERLAMMDAGGIEVQVLSFSAPNLWHPDPSVRAALVRTWNDGAIELSRAHPDRFKVFANVPLPFVDEALAETQRVGDDPAVVGFGICTHIDSTVVDDPAFERLYAAWNERGATVMLHPDRFCVPGLLAAYGMEWSLGAVFDDTIAVIRILRSGLAARFPRITWV